MAFKYPAGPLLELINRAGGMGGAVTIRPVVETDSTYFGGLDAGPRDPVGSIEGWEISYETLNGHFIARGKSVSDAAAVALVDEEAWA